MLSANRKILLVDNKDSFTYNLVQSFEELGCFVEVSSDYNAILHLMANFDRVVFSPGPGLPIDFPVMFEVLKRMKPSVRILGICLGHQAIAEFFGARLFKQEKVQHGQRKRIYNVCKNAHSAMFKMPAEFDAALYHSWAILPGTLPEELQVTCKSIDEVIMGICHKTLPVEGIQFHPESFLTEIGPDLLNNWLTE